MQQLNLDPNVQHTIVTFNEKEFISQDGKLTPPFKDLNGNEIQTDNVEDTQFDVGEGTLWANASDEHLLTDADGLKLYQLSSYGAEWIGTRPPKPPTT